MSNYVLGVDYGTDSVRAIVADASDGSILGTGVFEYPRWKAGLYCDPAANRFRQHPLDYVEGMESSIRQALEQCSGEQISNIRAIAVDTTGSTPAPVDEQGTPLALLDEFSENPDAMFVLWKDHTAVEEAREINERAHGWSTDYTMYSGGIYSSEWFWSKLLHIVRQDSGVAEHLTSFVECCDWLPALLTGNTGPSAMKRSRCAAGHKAMWHASFGGYPSEEFLSGLHPVLGKVLSTLGTETCTAEKPIGRLCSTWAAKLGLSEEVVICGGALDAHFGAIGGGIKPKTLLKVIGTSTCDMMVVDPAACKDAPIRGICGEVDGSIIPGLIGLEAGQSAFGDIYAWYKNLFTAALDLDRDAAVSLLPNLEKKAARIPLQESDPVAVDWFNGRRTPDADQRLKGAVMGLTLGTSPEMLMKALVESTAYGAKAIAERFEEEGIGIDSVLAIGGVAKKSGFVMQTLADVLNRPIQVVSSDQACALGAAMIAAAGAGIYASVEEAQTAMGSAIEHTYTPVAENAAIHRTRYRKYRELGNFMEQQAH